MKKLKKILTFSEALTCMLLLSGCDIAVLHPAGLVAKAQRDLIVVSLLLMLCIVIPVMIAIVAFAIKYRVSNSAAEYLPEWGESHKVEFFMWGIPICIVAVLAVLSAYFIHQYEPSKPLDLALTDDGHNRLLRIDVVALEWKWLFIYPEYGIATINEIYAPTGQQVSLQLTAENTINAFWVPKLGTVLYAMPQMNAKLHLVSEEDGQFSGISANYSGEGFSNMRFTWNSVSHDDFNHWVARVRQSSVTLDSSTYLALTQRNKNTPVTHFSEIEKNLYYRIVNRCVVQGSQCNEYLMRLAAEKSLWGELCSVFNFK
ncbi:MAG: cytochrome o ubiquinol oxidase subunit II [Candidatus Tokpelaia sp. JSC085]|nr:MAG: cytochrome o ubiquinol oxidase subunit II [Candidatus Tokpelaia sp. JSC085]